MSPAPRAGPSAVVGVRRIHSGPYRTAVTDGAGTARGPRARELLSGRELLRDVVAVAAPWAADAAVVYDPRGAPALAGHTGIGISVSHDGPWVAAAVADGGRVGVDLQMPVPGSWTRLAARCLRERRADVRRLPAGERDVELAWVWTAQEACVKARGTGLAGLPWAIDVPPFAVHGRQGELDWHSLRGRSAVPLSVAVAPNPHDPTTGRTHP